MLAIYYQGSNYAGIQSSGAILWLHLPALCAHSAAVSGTNLTFYWQIHCCHHNHTSEHKTKEKVLIAGVSKIFDDF